jgi:hypothetical protein
MQTSGLSSIFDDFLGEEPVPEVITDPKEEFKSTEVAPLPNETTLDQYANVLAMAI